MHLWWYTYSQYHTCRTGRYLSYMSSLVETFDIHGTYFCVPVLCTIFVYQLCVPIVCTNFVYQFHLLHALNLTPIYLLA